MPQIDPFHGDNSCARVYFTFMGPRLFKWFTHFFNGCFRKRALRTLSLQVPTAKVGPVIWTIYFVNLDL